MISDTYNMYYFPACEIKSKINESIYLFYMFSPNAQSQISNLSLVD